MSARNAVKSIQDIMRQDSGVDGDAQRLSQLCWMFFLKIIDDQDQQLEVMQDNYRSPIPEKFQWRTWAANPEGITGDALLSFINSELFPALKELPTSGKNASRARVVKSVFEDAYNYMKSGQLMRQVINKISGVDFNDLASRRHFGDIYEQLLNDLQSAGNAGEYYTPRAVTAFMVDRIDPRPGEILFDPSCGTGGFLTCAIRHMRDRYVKKVEDEQALQAGLRAVEKKQLPHMLCVTNMLLHGIEDPSFVRHDNTLARPYISHGAADRVDIILTNPPFGGREEDGIESNFPAHFRTKETADLFLALFIRLLKRGGRAAIVLPDGSLFGEGVKTRLKEALLQECNLHTIVRLPNSVFKPYASIGTNLLFFEKGEPTQEIWFYEHRVPEGQKAYSMTRPIRVEYLQGCVDWWGGAARENRQETGQAWRVGIDEIKSRNYNLDFKNPHTVAADHGDPQALLARLEADEAKAAALRDQLKAILAEAPAAMNADMLLQHFNRISEAPDAVARLRRFILDLAVRGKLVEQDPNDEPATELLKRIQTGKTKKAPALSPVAPVELPFDSPSGWSAARFGDVYSLEYGDNLPAEKRSNTGEYPVYGSNGVVGSHFECFVNSPCIVVGRKGSAGALNLSLTNGCCVTDVAYYCIPPSGLDMAFSFKLFHTLRLDSLGKGVKPGLSRNEAYVLPIAIPPLAEQHRIVAKVDELMALCDQLETQLTATLTDSRRLCEAVLRDALAPAMEEEAAVWACQSSKCRDVPSKAEPSLTSAAL